MTTRLLRLAAAVVAAVALSTVVAEGGALAQPPAAAAPARVRGRAGAPRRAPRARADDFAAAEAKFREAISLDSKLIDAYWRLAAVLYGQKKYEEAVELLRRAPDQADLDMREQLGLSLYKRRTRRRPRR